MRTAGHKLLWFQEQLEAGKNVYSVDEILQLIQGLALSSFNHS